MWKNIDVRVRALKFGVARKNIDVRVRTLKFDTARKNIGAQVCALKFGVARCRLSGACVILVHTIYMHNNGMCGVCSVDIAQRNFVGVRTMWVYVVV